MIAGRLKRLASHLPTSWQQGLKRLHYARQIRRGSFGTSEPEFGILASMLNRGDWVIDVGANVGLYTKRFSDLVGPLGRVIALEPVSETGALLAANAALFQHANVTIVNLAASDATKVVGLRIPRFDSGLTNYYEAAVTTGAFDREVLAVALDSLGITHRVALIKVDAEGHDATVLHGALGLLERDRPALIVESISGILLERLAAMGYEKDPVPGSPNTVFRHAGYPSSSS